MSHYAMSDFMQLLFSERADAVHLHPGERPVIELRRVLSTFPLEGPPVAADEPENLLRDVASEEEFAEFEREGRVCFYARLRDVAVFQVMGFRENGHVRVELRRFR